MSDARAGAVTHALRDAGALSSGEAVERIEQIEGGWSRHTYVGYAPGRRYVVRVKPRGALLDTDLGLEYRVYAALEDQDIATPHVYALDESDDTPFGGPFFVMDHVDGRCPNVFRPRDRAFLEEDWARERTIARDMLDNLARIHTIPPERIPDGVPELGFLGVVDRWQSVYEERRLMRDPVVEEAFAWIRERTPPDTRPGLVHGDYSVRNALVADGRVRAILDWELAYRGDVRFDLGYLALDRMAGKHLRRRSPLMGSIADEAWFLHGYAERTGIAVDREIRKTFEMLAIMMLLATQYTAVWMYARGRTTDFRMAWARFSFPGLRQDMVRLMAW